MEDLVKIGRIRLNSFVDVRKVFSDWLTKAENDLVCLCQLDLDSKEAMMQQTEAFKAFKVDLELNKHDLDACEIAAAKYLQCAKVITCNKFVTYYYLSLGTSKFT